MAGKGTIGVKIALEGEAKYKQALKDIKSAQTLLRSEMKMCTAEFKANQNSVDALAKRQQILTKQVEQAQAKVKVYASALKDAEAKEKEATEARNKARKSYEEAVKAQEELEKSGKATAEATKQQAEKVRELKDALSVAEKNYSKAVDQTNKYKVSLNNANTELIDLNGDLKKNDQYLDEAKRSTDQTAKSVDEYGREVKTASSQTNIFGDVLKANLTSAAVISGIKALAGAMKEIASSCVETGMEFESSMSKVSALSGATGVEYDRLADKAKEMGASTMYSASEAADAMSYMALAGWKVDEMFSGIEPILSLAAAANMDLATASDIVTDNLTAFGLEAKDAAKFSDQMAYAMANSNTDVNQLGEAYKNCAAAASSMNFSVEDVTAALMTMANAGVKGGEAGTTLRSIMVRLATNTKDCRDELEKYGVQITDEQGNLLNLSDIIYNVSTAFEGMSDTQAASLSKIIAGQSQYTGLQTVLKGVNQAAEEGGMSLGAYADALATCDGYANQMANTMQDNLKGKLTILDSSLQALQESTYELFDETMKEGVDAATEAVGRLNASVKGGSLNVSLNRLSKSLGNFIEKLIDATEEGLPKFIDGLSWFIDNAGGVAGAIGTIAVAFNTLKVMATLTASTTAFNVAIEGATASMGEMWAMMMANPVALLTEGVIALTVALGAFAIAGEITNDHVTEGTDGINKLADGYRSLTNEINGNQNSRKQALSDMEEEGQYAEELKDRLFDLNEEYKSLSGVDATANMEEQKNIIAQLNAMYPNLCLAINEETGALNQGNGTLSERIELLKKEAKIEAQRQYLVEIATEQIEARKKLKQAEADYQTALENRDAAQKKVNQEQELANSLMGENAYALDNATLEYQEAARACEEMRVAQEEAQAASDGLATEYNQMAAEIEEAGGSTDMAADSLDGLADSAEGASGAVQQLNLSGEELEEFTKNVVSSVNAAVNAFEEWNNAGKVSKDELKKNLDSQIEGLTQWADDFETLSKRGIDEGLLRTLAEMGPEAEGYIQGLLSMDDDELAEYSKKYAKAMTLKETEAQEVIDSYQTAGQESAEAYKEGFKSTLERQEEMQSAAEGSTEGFKTTLERQEEMMRGAGKSVIEKTSEGMEEGDLPGKATEVAEATDEALATGIEDNAERPAGAAETVAKGVVDKLKEGLSHDAMYDIGKSAMESLAQGISENGSVISATIQKIIDEAIANAKNSAGGSGGSSGGSSGGKGGAAQDFSGGSSSKNFATAPATVDTVNRDSALVTQKSLSDTSASLNSLVNIINDYLPKIADKDSSASVKVEFEPNEVGMFNVVRRQNKIFKTSTGVSGI